MFPLDRLLYYSLCSIMPYCLYTRPDLCVLAEGKINEILSPRNFCSSEVFNKYKNKPVRALSNIQISMVNILYFKKTNYKVKLRSKVSFYAHFNQI